MAERPLAPALPRISVLTPCLNGARYIGEAIESVRAQDYPDLEHLVLDGCSTDGTLAVLARYPEVVVISEPDAGSHDALNKGVARATGEIVGFLNSDDIYPANVLRAVGARFAADPTIDVVVGDALVFRDDASGARREFATHTHSRGDGLWLPELTFGIHGLCCCFIRRRILAGDATFDQEYYITADRRLLISLSLAGAKSAHLEAPAIAYRSHPGSATIDPRRRNLMAMSTEYFLMGAELAERTKDRPQLRRVFRAWRAVEGAKLMLRHLGNGAVGEAAAIFSALSRRNPGFPVEILHGLILRHAVSKARRADMRALRARGRVATLGQQ
jgi:glycosyltransferase involved in cell wall biosynthesis